MIKATELVQNGLKGIPLWAAIGNHDNYPEDIFKAHKPHENLSVNEWSKKWKLFDFLKDPVQRKHFEEYGFYSAPFTNHKGELIGNHPTKVIQFNANYCYQFNWYLMT